MRGLIRLAVQQPLMVLLATGFFSIAGVLAFQSLSVEAFPDVTDTQVTVISLYPGRAAEEVEKQVTLPIETALSGLPNAIRVFSHTQFGLSFTVVTYDEGAQVQLARQLVSERLLSVDLPPGVQAEIAPNATPVGEILRYRLRGDGYSTTQLRTLQDWVVERKLRQVAGVADVVALGGFIKQYEVQPDVDRLRAAKLTFQNLLDALGRGNSNAGGSYISQGSQQFAIRGIGLLQSADDIGQIMVTARNGTPILVRDVAQVKIGAVPRLGVVGQDLDDDIITGIVIMRKGENPSVVLANVKAKITEVNALLPKGVEVVPFYDRSWLMGKTLSTVFKNLVEGALLVSIVLFLFLSNLRASLVVVVIIPLALLATFLGLKVMGVPANLLSLGAMDFGIIVDGAVIMVENIMHRLAAKGERISNDERPTLFSMLIIIAAH
ncbi:MAG: efflux RND transporter permease subunit, partial [Betaproteobacteria bacterium]|nr:efflux RND transporter permease subunit [Betaproteobacteria bacterium]